MSDVTIDLSNYKDRVGQRIMPGRYRVVVDDAEQDVSKAGNTMVNLWLRVLDGDFAQAVVIDRLVISEKSMFRVVAFLQAIGVPTPKKRFVLKVRSLIGKTLEIDVEDGEPYNGRVKSEVRGYMRLTRAAEQITDLGEPDWVADAPAAAGTDDILAGIEEASAGGDDAPLDLDSIEL